MVYIEQGPRTFGLGLKYNPARSGLLWGGWGCAHIARMPGAWPMMAWAFSTLIVYLMAPNSRENPHQWEDIGIHGNSGGIAVTRWNVSSPEASDEGVRTDGGLKTLDLEAQVGAARTRFPLHAPFRRVNRRRIEGLARTAGREIRSHDGPGAHATLDREAQVGGPEPAPPSMRRSGE